MLNQQNSLDCVSFYERSLKINNKSYLTFNGLGNFYLKTNQFEKAENSTLKQLKLIQKDLLKYTKIVLIFERNKIKIQMLKKILNPI